MSLINKLRVVGSLGILVLTIGCDTVGPDGRTDGERIMDGFTELSLGPIANANAQLSKTPQKAAAWSAIGQFGNNEFYRNTQIEAAKAGRSEVNVNIGNAQSKDYIVIGDKIIYGKKQPDGTIEYNVPQDPETQRIIQERLRNLGIEKPREEKKEIIKTGIRVKSHSKFERIIMATYNYISDLNNNNKYELPDEAVGIKERFSTKEKMTIQIGASKKIPDLIYKLTNRNGEILDTVSSKEGGYDSVYGLLRVYNDKEFSTGINLTPGNYVALWYSGDEFLGKLEFEVYEEK
ncbi:hypothetical protein HYW75_02965 [Candidatus Pacearchaeota archaeon]|nr:hypothetical protein [Candidatus Pacearchaeota archaeon]